MPAERPASSVVVVGAGIIGRAVSWRLAQAGHPVTLVDPTLDGGPSPNFSGSLAALGVLMARVAHRSGGRAWRLRQQSLNLWGQWLEELEQRGHHLPRRRGLLLLAATAHDLDLQSRIAADRARLGMPLRQLAPEELKELTPQLPGQPLGGLLSLDDGQLDPGSVMEAMLHEAKAHGVACLGERGVAVERGRPWRLQLASGGWLAADWLVLTLGLGTARLLNGLGWPLELEPVLGQALELELADAPAWTWPGAVVWRGINLVPRPDLGGEGRRLWLGATLEPGTQASAAALAELRSLGGEAPSWLRQATVVRQWEGMRCQPKGQPAPVLAEPEPGLLVASGHYRNGVLLAPATADWVCEAIKSPHRRGLKAAG